MSQRQHVYQEMPVRALILTLLLFPGAALCALAQTADRPMAPLFISADSITKQPVHGFDGVIRPGPAEFVTTAVGKVVIRINGVEISANDARWHSSSNEIELMDGAVRVRVPGNVNELRLQAEQSSQP